MSHLKEAHGKYFTTQQEGFHYLLGALCSEVSAKIPAEEKVRKITALLQDFNSLFPSAVITKALPPGCNAGDYIEEEHRR